MHAPATVRLRRSPRPILGSIDRAGALVQAHAREVVVGSALIVLPAVVLGLAVTSLAFDRYDSLRGSIVSIPELIGGYRAATGVEETLVFISLLVASLTASIVGGYVSAIVTRSGLGRPVSIRASYRSMLPRLGSIAIAWLIGHCWIALGAFALTRVDRDGLTALLVIGGPIAACATAFTLVAAPVIVIERLGPIAGLRRAISMARTQYGTFLGFVLASASIGVFFQYGIAYLPRLLQAIGLVSFGRFGWLIEGIAVQLGRLISIPLVAAASAAFYLEVRMNKEGMDLLIEAGNAFVPPRGSP